MTTCSTCAHWAREDSRLHAGVEYRQCKRIRHRETIEDEGVERIGRPYEWEVREAAEEQALASSKAYCTDASGYHAAVITAGDFGCVLHEVMP